MCDSKAEGGRRCVAHTVQEFVASIKSKNANVDKVTEKAENVLTTAHAPQVYENKAKEKFSAGEEKLIVANRNLTHLKALKTNSSAIKQNITKVDYDREYLSNSEKKEYDTLKTDADKKKWFEKKAKADANVADIATLAWRADPNSVYDRVGIPSEHDSLLDDKKLEVDYVLAIGRSTEDPAIREKAIQHLIDNHGYSRDSAEVAIPKSVSISLAEYQEEVEAEEEAQKTSTVTVRGGKTWYGGEKKVKLTKEEKEAIKTSFDAKQKAAKEAAKNQGKKKPTTKSPDKKKVERTWYGAVKKPVLTPEQKEELKMKQAIKAYEDKLKQKEANKIKRRKAVKKFFIDLFR